MTEPPRHPYGNVFDGKKKKKKRLKGKLSQGNLFYVEILEIGVRWS